MISIGIISVSDRAFNKVYQDKGIPEIEKIFSSVKTFLILKKIIVPDEKEAIKANLLNYLILKIRYNIHWWNRAIIKRCYSRCYFEEIDREYPVW